MFRLAPIALFALAPVVTAWVQSQEAPGAKPELNEPFRQPDVGSFVERFESESREVFARRDEILRSLGLERGMDVADVGAGTGLFTMPMAAAVGPDGAAFAVDVAPDFLRHVADRARRDGLVNVCTVLGDQHSTNLPPGSVDLVFVCDTYHHFEDPAAMLASIRRALRPGGRLAVIDFDRREGVSSDFVLEHVRADSRTIIAEIIDAGFDLTAPEGGGPELGENFFALFVRGPGPEADRPGAGR